MVSINFLKESEIFRGLSESQLQKIAAIAGEKSYPAGSILFKEGSQARNLYIVEEGKVALEMKINMGGNQPARLATVDALTKGEALGWSSLIDPHVFTLSALCMDASKLVTIDSPKLLEILKQDTAMGFEIMKSVAKLIASRLTRTRVMLISERGLSLLTEY
ncbi:MAG: cyclic nucleotide-binding domain-containing protein [Dehalococcoidia bacterium]|nr:cyclic nucleotide-binding domain-containing protein [Dehalococcoidia bacterium]MDZ4246701.1 cyclic nucleotide-binding domain-containing protein [Dehalococcoidia bacterium]